MTATASKFDTMGKEALRAACRKAGVSYSKLNNDGMRAALVAHYTKCEESVSPRGVFAQLLGKVPTAANVGNVTRVVDGKRVGVTSPKGKSESRACAEKRTPAPRVSRKGYTIQKDREERNGVKRPSEGTICGAVWAEFDKNPQIKAGELAALADANGWNRTNVSCEFYAWRKFMGIKGRSAK